MADRQVQVSSNDTSDEETVRFPKIDESDSEMDYPNTAALLPGDLFSECGSLDVHEAQAAFQDELWGHWPTATAMTPMPVDCPSTMMVVPCSFRPQAAWGDMGPWNGGENHTAAFAMKQADAWLRVAEAHGAMSWASQAEIVGSGTSNYAYGDEACWTTVIMRNLPTDYTRDMFLSLLDAAGFGPKYNFVYLPSDFKSCGGLGYAFVNMEQHEDALALWDHFTGFSNWAFRSRKVCEVAWSTPYQGLAAHIERYRNSPVMHPEVDDSFKPVIFKHGKREEFPAPTKHIRRPRLRYPQTPVAKYLSTVTRSRESHRFVDRSKFVYRSKFAIMDSG